jgi:hypothetical protein
MERAVMDDGGCDRCAYWRGVRESDYKLLEKKRREFDERMSNMEREALNLVANRLWDCLYYLKDSHDADIGSARTVLTDALITAAASWGIERSDLVLDEDDDA